MDLLSTRNGNYAAACSLDFSKPPQFYDTFALRDSAGDEAVTSTFPYFRSSLSRNAIISGRPVPVQSCWNGMGMLFFTQDCQHLPMQLPQPHWPCSVFTPLLVWSDGESVIFVGNVDRSKPSANPKLDQVAFDAKPFYSNPPLLFRGVSDSLALYHLEASECCLIHVDNPLTPIHGVWLNPAVRVGYNHDAYLAMNTKSSLYRVVQGIWVNRLWRWITPTFHKKWRVGRRLKRWKGTNRQNFEAGTFCLINEMQVLIPNGWAHV